MFWRTIHSFAVHSPALEIRVHLRPSAVKICALLAFFSKYLCSNPLTFNSLHIKHYRKFFLRSKIRIKLHFQQECSDEFKQLCREYHQNLAPIGPLYQLERLQRRRLGENFPAPVAMDVSIKE